MYRKFVKISLILVYLVIIAGAVVRMTGSGMGCPDWPKCFGYYIPPTEITEIQFQEDRNYKKGQVIIVDESLMTAAQDFKTGATYNPQDWVKYTKHDYAIFNPWHTWIEYINRLFGALAGLAVLIMAFLSLKYWRDNKKITLLSWLSVFLMGFQGWLGATVVFSVLSPVKITIHMVMALVIVALILYLLQISKAISSTKIGLKSFRSLSLFAVIFTLIQIILGTQVRQFVDEQIKLLGYDMASEWLATPSVIFYIHRSFSILVVILNLLIWWQNKKLNLGFNKVNWVLGIIGLEVITGIAMYNFDFPALSQPLHLVIASLLFGLQFYILLEALRAPIRIKSL
ncbi:cytochrome c oxidase assembly protein subunit 15 [Gillisia mitskevichiae]|uniref:Cytochrome c oxidase assembly protein subunit 15 n=1 Tax=Gillisia mitskevichiae TaxID=270921 RepID=A0A495PVA1_9FLAO|nr:COX15/CtaA family protein [Gillisia mitskevichiae]RKS53472.1 cytochrome c oxidase assembly protein subunit 15 [Gillisia mitskevichiae]